MTLRGVCFSSPYLVCEKLKDDKFVFLPTGIVGHKKDYMLGIWRLSMPV